LSFRASYLFDAAPRTMFGRLCSSQFGDRRLATHRFEEKFVFELAEHPFARIGVNQIGSEGAPNFPNREVQNCDACVGFGANKIDNVATLLTPDRRFDLLQ
jgi:hypothetical protein